jgi:hypothetical protein
VHRHRALALARICGLVSACSAASESHRLGLAGEAA